MLLSASLSDENTSEKPTMQRELKLLGDVLGEVNAVEVVPGVVFQAFEDRFQEIVFYQNLELHVRHQGQSAVI